MKRREQLVILFMIFFTLLSVDDSLRESLPAKSEHYIHRVICIDHLLGLVQYALLLIN